MSDTTSIQNRLEELRALIRAESISYGEIAELTDLAEHIERGNTELLEWAGVPEFPDTIESIATFDAQDVDRELNFALRMTDTDDPNALRWLAALCQARIDQLDAK